MSSQDDVPDAVAYKKLVDGLFPSATVCIALAMARETGMLDVLLQADRPLSSVDVATQAKLKERYVREILSSLATMRVVQLEEGTGKKEGPPARFFVPTKHRSSLTSSSLFCLIAASMGKRYSNIKACIDLDGPHGLRYSGEFFDMQKEVTAGSLDAAISAFLETPGLRELAEKGIQVAEIGSGSGEVSCRLAAKFPTSHFTITEISPEAMERCKKIASQLNVTNVSFQILDVCHVPDEWNDRFDWIVCRDVIHDLPYPEKGLEGVRKMLKPGGHFSMEDVCTGTYLADNVGDPVVAAFYASSTFHCVAESYQHPDSKALGSCWGEQKARDMLQEAGFQLLNVEKEGLGYLAVYMCQKPA